jgi:hypothetical protein
MACAEVRSSMAICRDLTSPTFASRGATKQPINGTKQAVLKKIPRLLGMVSQSSGHMNCFSFRLFNKYSATIIIYYYARIHDPGMGALAWQTIISAVVGLFFYLKKTRVWFVGIFQKLFR